ncbi:MAG: hypothetical protein ABIJ56_12030 [Pseudomonadota bacterium]
MPLIIAAAVGGVYIAGSGLHSDPKKALVDEAPTGFNPVKSQFIAGKDDFKIWLCVQRDNLPAVNRNLAIEFDDNALLGVVIKKGAQYYTDLNEIEIDGKTIASGKIHRLSELPGWQKIWWMKIESKEHKYINSNKNDGWWAGIDYIESVEAVNRESAQTVDVRPIRLQGVKWKDRHVGTIRYKVAVEFTDFFLSTPGRESAGKGGLLPDVRRVSRKGNTGNATADMALSLANLPYIWGSAPIHGEKNQESHQAELYIGADCADLAVASWRLSNASTIHYSAVLPMVTKYEKSRYSIEIIGSKDEILFGTTGKGIPIGPGGVEPGTAIMWKFVKKGTKKPRGHAAVFVEDKGPGGRPNGVLDEHDVVLHALWNTPALDRIRDVLPGTTPIAAINPIGRLK